VTARVPKALIEAAQSDIEAVLSSQNTRQAGLSEAEASERLVKYGENEPVQEKRVGWFKRLLLTLRNPGPSPATARHIPISLQGM
jgi:magnesium-transporting ATPase (P-type)